MKIKINKVQGQVAGQNYDAQILDAPDGSGGLTNIGCGFAETADQALLVAGAMMSERDLPIFGVNLEIEVTR